MKVVIAVIMKLRDISEYKVLDTNSCTTTLEKAEDLKEKLRFNRTEYMNVKLGMNNQIEFVDSSVENYTCLDDLGLVMNHKSFVILGIELANLNLEYVYHVCDYNGILSVLTRTELLRLVNKKKYVVSNANVHGLMIEPYSDGSHFRIIKTANKSSELDMKPFDSTSNDYTSNNKKRKVGSKNGI